MKLNEEQLKELKESYTHERHDWNYYYASQFYYKRGMLSVLIALGVSEEQLSQIDKDEMFKSWDWRQEE